MKSIGQSLSLSLSLSMIEFFKERGTSSSYLLLVEMPRATSSVLAPSSDALCS